MPCINCPMLGGSSGADLFNREMDRLRDPLNFSGLMNRINDPTGLQRTGSLFRYQPSTALLRAWEDAKKP